MCARERQNTRRLMTARRPLRRIYKTAAAFVESIFYCSANDAARCPIVLLGCKDKILLDRSPLQFYTLPPALFHPPNA